MYPLVDAIFKFNLPAPKALDLFEKLVQPILLYGSEVLASFSSHQLNFISKNSDALLRYSLESSVNTPKLKFCKQILGLKRNSSSLAVYGELGIIPTALFAIRGGWEQERVAINCEPSKLRTGLRGRGLRNIFWATPLGLQEKRPFSGKRFLKRVCFCAN